MPMRAAAVGLAWLSVVLIAGEWLILLPLFGMGLIAAYIGLSALVVSAVRDSMFGFLWFSATGVAILVGLLVAHHALRGRP